MTCYQHTCHPGCATNYIKKSEFLFLHINKTCYNRCKSSDDRHKPCRNNSPSAIPLIKIMGLHQVFFLEQKTVFSLVQIRTAFFTKPISNIVTNNTGCRYKYPEYK